MVSSTCSDGRSACRIAVLGKWPSIWQDFFRLQYHLCKRTIRSSLLKKHSGKSMHETQAKDRCRNLMESKLSSPYRTTLAHVLLQFGGSYYATKQMGLSVAWNHPIARPQTQRLCLSLISHEWKCGTVRNRSTKRRRKLHLNKTSPRFRSIEISFLAMCRLCKWATLTAPFSRHPKRSYCLCTLFFMATVNVPDKAETGHQNDKRRVRLQEDSVWKGLKWDQKKFETDYSQVGKIKASLKMPSVKQERAWSFSPACL